MKTTSVLFGPLAHNRKPIVRFRSSYLVRCPFARNGFLVIGPHWIGILTTVAVILGGTWMNLRVLNKSTNVSATGKLFMTGVIYIFCLLSNLLLWVTALGDPGIVFPTDMDDNPIHLREEWEEKRLQYCDICTVLTPDNLNIGHCYTCGYCIEGLDHHCPWMGQCIGKKNKAAFIIFNISWIIFFLEYFFLAIISEVDPS